MKKNLLLIPVFLGMQFILLPLLAQHNEILNQLVGAAFQTNTSYGFLQDLSDIPGARLSGSDGNRQAVVYIKEKLEKVGYPVRTEKFSMPGWVRGDDEVRIIAPFEKSLTVAALGYVQSGVPVSGILEYCGYGYAEDYPVIAGKNRIAMITSQRSPDRPALVQQEALQIAAAAGVKAVLFIHSKPGNLVRARTGDFHGMPTPVPAFSISMEQGVWLKRLIEKEEKIELEIVVRSYCQPIESENILVTLPGVKDGKIVIGAHFDSWDLGQGSIDNGLGTAILYEVARLMREIHPNNLYTIEFVWFNGEELGLFGSKDYLNSHAQKDILAMINLDMTGSPTGFNAMGFDEYVPLLKNLEERLSGMDLEESVISRPWTNSDHMPFMLAGIPVLTLQAYLDREMIDAYHTAADTFDKVNKKYLSEAAAVVSCLLYTVSNQTEVEFSRKSPEETAEMLKKFGLDTRLKKQKEWPFSVN